MSCALTQSRHHQLCEKALTDGACTASVVASYASIEAALEPVKLLECIGKGGRDVGSRFAVQAVCLDEPRTSGGIPERASKVTNGLGVVVGALPTGSGTPRNRQPTESDVVHDHVGLGQDQIVAITGAGVRIRTGHMQHADPHERGETLGGSPCGGELSTGRGSTEMISDRRPNANRKVLVECVGEHLLPTPQAWGFGRSGLPVAAPGTGNRHIDLFCHLIPGQALVAAAQRSVGWRWDVREHRVAW